MLLRHMFAMAAFARGLEASAQVYFPNDTDMCEYAPWKLVWADEFDGDTIKTANWYTYSDVGNWGPTGIYIPAVSEGARSGNECNFLDENVVVSNGTCKLTIKPQPNTWGNSRREYSSGYLMAKHWTGSRWDPLSFRKGRFDMRARLPTAPGVWATFWLWNSGKESKSAGSEIDFIEYTPERLDKNRVSTSLHGWNRGAAFKDHIENQQHYRLENLDDWHLYSCIWDDNYVRIYVDGNLKITYTRFLRQEGRNLRSNSACVARKGIYLNDPKECFPVSNQEMSLRLGLDYTSSLRNGRVQREYEIDYVRVYQRNIQKELTDLCGTLEGPADLNGLDNNGVYTYTGKGKILAWTVTGNLRILTKYGNTLTAVPMEYGTGIVKLKFEGEPGCELTEISYPVNIRRQAFTR